MLKPVFSPENDLIWIESRDARPLSSISSYRTPIDGYYLCGVGMHPGGGVMGASGHNAARAVLAGFGPGGVFWSIVISESLLSVFGVAVFRHGNWRLQQV